MTFIDFARANGVLIEHHQLYASEKIRRCGTSNKPRSKNGSFMWNGVSGWVKDWSSDYPQVIWYKPDPDYKPSKQDQMMIARFKENAEQQRKQREDGYKAAAKEAQEKIDKSAKQTHAYLKSKGFAEHLGFVLDGKLLIPMRNVITGELQGLQSIYPVTEEGKVKFEKKMQYGMRSKDAVYIMGSKSSTEKWLVEGYATGESLRMALQMIGSDAQVIVCFSANNLLNVSSKIKGDRYIFADNDKSETGQKIADATGLLWTSADTEGWDANDLHMNKGLFAVVKKIHELKKKQLLAK